MILLALTLMATGLVAGLLGYKLFKILLPLIGLVGGSVIGFIGFQTLFGTGIVSTTVAIFVAITFGLLLALLSFMYFRIAVTVYTAALFASLLTYLGATLGFAENEFVLALLSISGITIGIIISSREMFSERLVLAMTSFIGVGLILEGIFLATGNVTIDQLNEQGVITSVIEIVDQSFLWLFIWLGGGLLIMQLQRALLVHTLFNDKYQLDIK